MRINKNTKILITGGTGSFGQRFVKTILDQFPDFERLVVFSRDELKQYEMRLRFPEESYPGLRFFLGDLRDQQRIEFALQDIDVVVHAAALKQVPAAEYNPFEFIKTNVLGAQNLIQAIMRSEVKRVVALSTDKASEPINLYGATKLCSDKLFIAANNLVGKRDLKFAVVRYGNVMNSRGSVIPYFQSLSKSGAKEFPITDKRMTRFNISLDQGVDFVLWSLDMMSGGEIFVPKLPSYNICDLARAVKPDVVLNEVGIRPGEKLHEQMISVSDSPNTLELDNSYIILPVPVDKAKNEGSFSRLAPFRTVDEEFQYESGTNSWFLSERDLKRLIESL